MRLVVIGAGAAGVCAAIEAARLGASVTVVDRNVRPLKKLCVTGNGRGNLMKEGPPAYYGDADFARAVLERVPPEDVRAFLQSAGLTLTADAEGRVYPAALMASVAADALLLQMKRYNVRVLSDARATAIERHSSGFIVRALQATREPERRKKNGKAKPGEVNGETPIALEADRVLVASGGAASPAHGTDGSAYALLTALGHTLTPIRPALCALLAAPPSGLSGQRARARLALLNKQNTPLHQSEGEILFCDDGVSGIAAMQLARFAEPGCTLVLDLRRAVLGDAEADARGWVEARVKSAPPLSPLAALLSGAASPALSRALFAHARIPCGGRVASELSPQEQSALAGAISAFALPVTGTRGFEQAQVTAGGIAASDFDPATLQSRLVPGLYAAGEVLDVDGDCGGFNLMFAFASGMLAGRASAV